MSIKLCLFPDYN